VLGQFALLGLLVVAGSPGVRTWPSSAPGWLGFVAGGAAILLGGWTVVRALLDLRQVVTPMPRPRPDGHLVESGIYARIRHPVYAGVMLIAVGWSVFTRSLPALGVTLLLAAFLDAKARREERWLLEQYDAYAAYRRRTRRFLPGLY
jgi:protein-S-isoprenylcysteine O-methyltransferase Ste14